MISDRDLGYIAGILDGEGTIHIRSNGAPDVQIVNADRELLEWIEEVVGGAVYARNEYRRLGRKPIYAWMLRGYRAVIFLRCVEPILRSKRARAIEALARWEASFETLERPARRLHHMPEAEADMASRGWTNT